MQNKSWEHTRIYKTEHSLEVKERSQIKQSRVSFDMRISCNSQDESIRRVFKRENYLINSQIPEDHHIRLLYELEQAIYPLEIEVNIYDNFERIPGHELWFSTWQKKVNTILKEKYSGEFAESLRDQIQESMETEEKLKQKIQQEAFWRLYFFGMNIPNNDKVFRWNILKAGTAFFLGDVQTKTEENNMVSLYRGKLRQLESSFIENLNELLQIKKTTQYKTPYQIEAECKIETSHEKKTGKLIHKSAEIKVSSTDGKYLYSEKLEIKYHGLSMRKMPFSHSFSFSKSENK